MLNLTDITPDALAASILRGDTPAAAAKGRPDAYDALNRSASGARLPFLGTSTKIDAGKGVGVLTAVLYMMPARAAGGASACPYASAGCEAACLAEYTGRMSMDAARTARRRRHASFLADRDRFIRDLADEIARHERKARKLGMVAAVRLNGTTDLLWERMPLSYPGEGASYPNLMSRFPAVTFYDYTKIPLRMRERGSYPLPDNYSLTYSLSEREGAEDHAGDYLSAGYGVAVVFAAAKGALPTTYPLSGAPRIVIDGDKHDARFMDPAGVIVGLSAKGRAKHDASGFVRNPDPAAA